jgi:hypothetical protein
MPCACRASASSRSSLTDRSAAPIDVAVRSQALALSPAKYEPILKGRLISHLTGEEFKTIPKLKAHLATELQKAERKRKQK